MRKQSVLLMLLAVLFTASVTTSCKKSSSAPADEEQPGGGGGTTNPNLSKYLKGSDYYLITLDATSEKNIHAKVKKDYRTDNTNMFLYVWPDGTSYAAGTSSGPNSFGEVEGWTSLVVANLGWSGAGFSPSTTYKWDLSGLTDSHVLHFAIKSKDNASHQLILYSGTNTAKFTFGTTAIDGINPYGDFTRNGEWQHFEIPYSAIKNQGIRYAAGGHSENILAVLSGGVAGTTLDIDGVFFYVPAK